MKSKIITTAILFNHNKEILIGQRAKSSALFPGLWEFPGGKLEDGESPECALMRELKEELSIDVLLEDISPYAFVSHAYETFHAIILCFECSKWSGEIQNNVHEALRWVKCEDLKTYPSLPANKALHERLILHSIKK